MVMVMERERVRERGMFEGWEEGGERKGRIKVTRRII